MRSICNNCKTGISVRTNKKQCFQFRRSYSRKSWKPSGKFLLVNKKNPPKQKGHWAIEKTNKRMFTFFCYGHFTFFIYLLFGLFFPLQLARWPSRRRLGNIVLIA